MGIQPCCGGSLQRATKWISIVSIVILTVGLALIALCLGLATITYFGIDHEAKLELQEIFTFNGTDSTEDGDINKDVIKMDGEIYVNVKIWLKSILYCGIYIYIALITALVASLVVSVELFKGARERNEGKCYLWLRFQIAQMIISILLTPMIIYLQPNAGYAEFSCIFTLIAWTVNFYFLYVVYSFIKEIRSDNANPERIVGLTKKI